MRQYKQSVIKQLLALSLLGLIALPAQSAVHTYTIEGSFRNDTVVPPDQSERLAYYAQYGIAIDQSYAFTVRIDTELPVNGHPVREFHGPSDPFEYIDSYVGLAELLGSDIDFSPSFYNDYQGGYENIDAVTTPDFHIDDFTWGVITVAGLRFAQQGAYQDHSLFVQNWQVGDTVNARLFFEEAGVYDLSLVGDLLITQKTTVVPLPSAAGLLFSALLGLGWVRLRKTQYV